MPPAAISPKGRFNQGGARSSGAHLNHLSSGPLRKRCRVEKTKVSEKDAGYHAAELSLGELRLAGAPVREKEGARAFARCHTIRCRLDRVKELTRLDMEKGEDRERRTWESKICNSSGPYRRNLLASPIAMAAKKQTQRGLKRRNLLAVFAGSISPQLLSKLILIHRAKESTAHADVDSTVGYTPYL